jgi:hypothetical protein
MLEWLRRRRLSAEAKRKLLIVAARSEEAVIETHVANVLDMLEILHDEVDVDRALELYGEMLPMDEHVSATVANRVIARHESPGSPRRRGGGGSDGRRFADVFRDPGGRK